ncbi:MAG: hypothetical protein PHH59_09550 [Methylovulum sp.]|uniref:hypothetical protein n=1 Tax=Methylovulum sp. TaxID=1916980 RepID=UPI00261E668A|nr:hypothetical protein [Methylovulum sp.]MDD2724249.1 hypothetical protein [Methylovulum sp.]MDD5123018.1 hypothetical protein [Methylovulum sp.]
MKRTTHKKTLNKRRPGTNLDATPHLPDDAGLADLRAIRDDDPVFTAVPSTIQTNEEDAIDRLLAISGFDNPAAGTALASSGMEPMSAVDDFEPDMARAFLVGPIEQDPHFQMQPLYVADVDEHEANLGQANFGDTPRAVDPLDLDDFGEDFGPDGLDVKTTIASSPLPDESHHKAAEATAPVAVDSIDETLVRVDDDFTPGQMDAEQAGQFARPIEPVFADIPAHTVETVPADVEFGREQAVVLGEDDLSHDAKNDFGPGPSDKLSAQNSPENSLSSHLCGHKAEVARINLITLVLSIAASLATLVFYFLLMDMREDLLKLNEMVDIIKEDSQMAREEPPVE